MRVSDTGVGMTPEMLETVFEPFTQADRTLERAQGGMGLGLTVVRRLVELHGGDVRATSAGLGRGSRVHRPPARCCERQASATARSRLPRSGRPAAAARPAP